MGLRIFTEPQQGASYDTLLRVARRAEDLGFDAFFRSDHYLTMGAASGLPGPTDAWMTLAGLARDTSHIRLGTLVTAATFRLPGPLAITVAQVDQMSGGRVELGLGTGWYDGEHEAYGIPFPPLGERFDRLEEQLAIITGLWATPVGETFSYDGAHYPVTDSPALPKPVQRRSPPVIIGGAGPKRTPASPPATPTSSTLPFAPSRTRPPQFDRVRARVRRERAATRRDGLLGRPGAVLRRATTPRSPAGPPRSAATRRAAGERPGRAPPPRSSTQIGAVRRGRRQRVYLQVLDLADLDHLDLLAAEVLPQVRRRPPRVQNPPPSSRTDRWPPRSPVLVAVHPQCNLLPAWAESRDPRPSGAAEDSALTW